jgi:NitT/TauT family transport system substrate-binding protein
MRKFKTMRTVAAACIVFAAATMFASLAYAQSLVPVKFRLDFRLSGPHLPYIWALEKGYYAEEGLGVTIKEGAGAQQTINLIAAKEDDLASGDFLVLANSVSKGAPVKAVFGYVQRNAWSVISFAEANLREPRDLIGKTVAVIADHRVFLELLLRTNDVPSEKVTMRVVNIAVRNTVFAERKVDAFISQVLGSPMDFVARAKEGKNPPVHFMLFGDFGVKTLSQGLIAHRNFIEQNPDVIRRFLRATGRAIKELAKPQNFDEATDIAIRYTKAAVERRESVRLQWIETLKFINFKETSDQPFGWMDAKDWNDTVDTLKKTGQIENGPALGDLYTNEFLR